MPAILVASKMKSGLPKPVHSATPILKIPARSIPQPGYLKVGPKPEGSRSLYSSQIPLKPSPGQEVTGDTALFRKTSSIENGFDTQQFSAFDQQMFCRSWTILISGLTCVFMAGIPAFWHFYSHFL